MEARKAKEEKAAKAAAKKAEKERKKAKKAASTAAGVGKGVESSEKGGKGEAPASGTAVEEVIKGVEQTSLQTS